jgi:WD40 repeat protein
MGVCCSNNQDKVYSRYLKSPHTSAITVITQLKDSTILTGSQDSTIGIYDFDSLSLVKELKDHKDQITSIIELDDGTVASIGDDRNVTIWEPNDSYKKVKNLIATDNIISSALKLKDGRIAISSYDRLLIVWNPNENYTCEAVMTDHTGEIDRVIELSDGRLATSGKDNTVRIWDNVTASKSQKILKLCDTKTLPGDNRQTSPAILELSGGSMLATGCYDNNVRIWDLKSDYSLLYTLKGHKRVVNNMVQSKNHLVTTGDDKIFVWDCLSGFKRIYAINAHKDIITSMHLLHDGKVVTTSSDRTVKIWDPKDYQNLHSLELDSSVTCLYQLKDDRLITGTQDGSLRIWGF